jgi:hypothetical protein
MSGEFGLIEGCAETSDMPSHSERVKEILKLQRKLMAADTLDNLSYAVKWEKESIQTLAEKPLYYLISYDNASSQVNVDPYFNVDLAMKAYDSAELSDNKSGIDTKNVVLVEADKVDTLRAAYPNYFGEVQLFKEQLKDIIGEKGKDYMVKPQPRVPSGARQGSDLSWLRRSRFGKPKGA